MVPNNSTLSEASTRRSAANLLTVIGFAYVSAIAVFMVAAQFEHEWGKLGMAILAAACVPPAVLIFITQNFVRRGKAAGWAKLMTIALSLPLLWFLNMGLSQLRWRWDLTIGEWLGLVAAAVLLGLHIRALILLGRWTFCRTLASQTPVIPPESPWNPFNEPPTDQLPADNSPASNAP